MKTVVYQAYEPVKHPAMPAWIERCIDSVRGWVAAQGYDYRFFDHIVDWVPDWYRESTRGDILPISDLARLFMAKRFLEEGYERTIWIDTDVLVFDPDRFRIEVTTEYAVCKEIWVQRIWGTAVAHPRINQAVLVLCRGNSFLDYYIHACCERIRAKSGEINSLDAGTAFLSGLHQLAPLPLLTNVGLLSPAVLSDVAAGGGPFAQAHMKAFGHRLQAANLTGSCYNVEKDGIVADDAMYRRVIDNLSGTRGGVLNRYLPR